jgi:hypothetical protein
MRSENYTPVEKRFLWLDGFVSPKALAQVSAGLPLSKPENCDTFFVGFSYADLPRGEQFQILFPKSDPEKAERCPSKVIAITQQFSKPFSEIPAGWKTVCQIHFPNGLPDLVKRLPTLDSWYQNREVVCLCNEESWAAIKTKVVHS